MFWDDFEKVVRNIGNSNSFTDLIILLYYKSFTTTGVKII